MKRFLALILCLLVVGGCETASQTASRQTDLRLFVADLNRSMEVAAAGEEGSLSKVIYRCFSDRPFKELPPAEFAEIGNARAAINRIYDVNSTLPPAERGPLLLEYANKGVPLAQFSFGGEVLLSTSIHDRDREAVGAEFVRRSAMQGCPLAQALLGYLYWKGIGVNHDKTQAYGWADSASFAGLDSATNLRAEISPYLTPAQLQNAKAISATWRQ